MSSRSSRSSEGAVSTAIRDAAETVADALERLRSPRPIVLIDGRSGAGKSSLARALRARRPRAGEVQLIGLDELYPGWDGLDDGAETACRRILEPHARGEVGRWQSWDWEAGRYDAHHVVDPDRPLIVEGSGIVRPSTVALSDIRIWLESPASSRRDRALARDGETYRPHWERWARQEERHIADHRPRELATHVFDVP